MRHMRQHGANDVEPSLLLIRPDSPMVGHHSALYQTAPQGVTHGHDRNFGLKCFISAILTIKLQNMP